jgi:hypothetical protein
MPAALPVVVQVLADPAPSEDQLRAVMESCSGAVGGGGCAPPQAYADEVRARITIRFADDLGRVHVEMVPVAAAAADARDADFRAGDPPIDRYRTAGLLAADLVLDHERELRAQSGPSPSPPLSPRAVPPLAPPAPIETVPTAAPQPTPWSPDEPPRASVIAADIVGATVVATVGERAWWEAVLAGDLGPRRSPFFGTASLLYGGTWAPSAAGISEHRFAVAVGGGSRMTISGPVSLRARAAVQWNDLRASVVQPGTGLTDAGGRGLIGLGADVAVVVQVAGPVDLELGVRGAWLGDSTLVRVQGQPVTTISAWTGGVSLGVGARFP